MSSDTTTDPQPRDELAGKLKRTELQHVAFLDPRPGDRPGAHRDPGRRRVGLAQHPGEEVGYIVAGTVRMEIQGPAHAHPAHRRRFLIPPRTPHNALDLGPDTGRMLSTYIVEVGAPIAELTGP